MRRFLSLTLALVAGLFVVGVPSAVAGGPTSVLLANYETGRSAAALNGSSDYTDLQSILGDENPPTAAKAPSALSESAKPTVRMVWLIHDVSPWRIDNVHLDGGDVWVETYLNPGGADPYAGTPTWHQPTRGAELVTVLTTLGVVGAGSSAADAAAAGLGALATQATDTTVAAPATGAPWWLAVTLAVLGIAFGAILGRRVGPGFLARRQVAAVR
ncbi:MULTISPECIES: hypothetical protein [unclassified Knoellia]|uniref:hypothetical protein n=1 Tax=Knoellia altitudinis TaxID=3404795 RepID=UPI003620AEEE